MNPDDIRKIQEMLEGSGQIDPLLIALVAIVSLAFGYFGTYLKEKGRNAATKEDIAEVTRKVEEVKAEMSEQDRISTLKYQQKREACLHMLTIIDAHLSHVIKKDNNGNEINVDKQYAEIESARKCHNDLLLSVDNPKIVEQFMSILLGKEAQPVKALDELRLEVRKEMGYEGIPNKNSDATWLGVLNCKREG